MQVLYYHTVPDIESLIKLSLRAFINRNIRQLTTKCMKDFYKMNYLFNILLLIIDSVNLIIDISRHELERLFNLFKYIAVVINKCSTIFIQTQYGGVSGIERILNLMIENSMDDTMILRYHNDVKKQLEFLRPSTVIHEPPATHEPPAAYELPAMHLPPATHEPPVKQVPKPSYASIFKAIPLVSSSTSVPKLVPVSKALPSVLSSKPDSKALPLVPEKQSPSPTTTKLPSLPSPVPETILESGEKEKKEKKKKKKSKAVPSTPEAKMPEVEVHPSVETQVLPRKTPCDNCVIAKKYDKLKNIAKLK